MWFNLFKYFRPVALDAFVASELLKFSFCAMIAGRATPLGLLGGGWLSFREKAKVSRGCGGLCWYAMLASCLQTLNYVIT